MRFISLLLAFSLIACPVLAGEKAPAPIKIGEFLSYTNLANYAEPWKKGWTLALEEINAQGGVLGRPIEIVSRDDMGQPDQAVRVMQEFAADKDIVGVMGGVFSHVALAASEIARREQTPLIIAYGATDKLLTANDPPYVFRVSPGTTVIARILAREAAGLHIKRWAFVMPQYEMGESMERAFRAELTRLQPDVQIVTTQWAPLKKIQAGAVLGAVDRTQPDAVFVGLLGSDLTAFVREGGRRHSFDNRKIVTPFGGFRQELGEMRNQVPDGWITFGYEADIMQTPEHRAFVAHYRARFQKDPDEASMYGYIALKAYAQALTKAGRVDRAAVRTALSGLSLETPVGLTHIRADNQILMGKWLGITAHDPQGHGNMRDVRYISEEQLEKEPAP